MKGPMVMVVTTTVVVTVVMIFPVTNCLVNVTGDVILDTQRLTAARVCSYTQKTYYKTFKLFDYITFNAINS